MKLGFIGTGKITSAVITGICSSSISYNKIIISERNKSTSSILKKKFTYIHIYIYILYIQNNNTYNFFLNY